MEEKRVILFAENSYVGPFWENGFCNIGDCNELWVDDVMYRIDFPRFKEWYMQADKYDPYSDVEEKFNAAGYDDWVKQGYKYAVMLRKLLPQEIDVYYAFGKDFGDNQWRYCKAHITL